MWITGIAGYDLHLEQPLLADELKAIFGASGGDAARLSIHDTETEKLAAELGLD